MISKSRKNHFGRVLARARVLGIVCVLAAGLTVLSQGVAAAADYVPRAGLVTVDPANPARGGQTGRAGTDVSAARQLESAAAAGQSGRADRPGQVLDAQWETSVSRDLVVRSLTEGDAPVAGAAYVLGSRDGDAASGVEAYTDEAKTERASWPQRSGADGELRLYGLVPGTYHLFGTEVPAGFRRAAFSHVIVIDQSGAVRVDGQRVGEGAVRLALYFEKVPVVSRDLVVRSLTEGDAPVAGAAYVLGSRDGDAASGVEAYTDEAKTERASWPQRSGADGELRLYGLVPGTYHLFGTEVPAGFRRAAFSHVIVIDQSGAVRVDGQRVGEGAVRLALYFEKVPVQTGAGTTTPDAKATAKPDAKAAAKPDANAAAKGAAKATTTPTAKAAAKPDAKAAAKGSATNSVKAGAAGTAAAGSASAAEAGSASGQSTAR
ncbi:hypothetical protein Corgl_1167 [Coriobacterium glomerans PW2]|uniref:Prealbumin-like fold domain-containing protein n=1 Tax=Coriobacterium glomerans (strain ATCC 49209 / DSM 20642 / JCM 10262 / PW2) TaxID=700015 RepID=F2N890_CORGP|nr:hypothetical protein [Coriobacterium glomerans]AEB07273.1 hypothetical protein Corgl_1167 [Coriobacterium glomerans PW2]